MERVPQKFLLGLDLQELTSLVEEAGEPTYRARQLFQAVYRQRLRSPDAMTTLPEPFRVHFQKQGIAVGWPEIQRKFVSSDGTARYLIKLYDGETVETVYMPMGDDG
ncbi:MAG: 23S rRNA (adenine(2503)-C(2))-methyltransferase RlmN, partial [Acidobacteria bacterium]|nr:23S rRNA (adenine(2503)-C(2))-methyltransferase RlmN [Acidobacteriota bacterium]